MRIRAHDSYYEDCGLDCEKRYCKPCRLLFKSCAGASIEYEGDSEVPGGINRFVSQCFDCPDCGIEGQSYDIYKNTSCVA